MFLQSELNKEKIQHTLSSRPFSIITFMYIFVHLILRLSFTPRSHVVAMAIDPVPSCVRIINFWGAVTSLPWPRRSVSRHIYSSLMVYVLLLAISVWGNILKVISIHAFICTALCQRACLYNVHFFRVKWQTWLRMVGLADLTHGRRCTRGAAWRAGSHGMGCVWTPIPEHLKHSNDLDVWPLCLTSAWAPSSPSAWVF